MVNNDADIIVTQCTIERDFNSEKTFNPENERIKEVWDRDGAINAFLDHKKLNGTLWTKMIKRELFEGVSFNLDQWYWEDDTVVWKVLLKCKKVVKLSSAYYHWRLHGDSMCARPISERRIKGALYIADLVYNDCREADFKKHYKMAVRMRIQRYCGIIYSIFTAKKSYPAYEKIIVSALRHNFIEACYSLSSVKERIMLSMIVLSPSLTKWAIYGRKKMLR